MQKKIWYAPNCKEAYGEDEIKAVTKCLNEGWLAPGKYTEEFEKRVSSYFGKKYGVMVNSGSSANLLALCVLDLKEGDEVITCALTFSTTVAPIVQKSLIPVFVDSEHLTFVPNVCEVLEKITPKTKVIMLANLAGSKPDWKGLREGLKKLSREDIVLIEDSCDTMTYTPESDISTASFYSSHVITSGGSGGMLMVNNEKLLKKALQYRDWGRAGNNSEDLKERFESSIDGIPYDFKFLYTVIGYNLKSSEMNAAFGLVQMEKLDSFLEKRRKNILRYVERLRGSSFLTPTNFENTDWLAMPLMSKKRKEVLEYLEKNNIQTRVFFAGNVTRHPAYRNFLTVFPEADRVMAEGFLLGAHHGMTEKDVDYLCDKLLEAEKVLGLEKE